MFSTFSAALPSTLRRASFSVLATLAFAHAAVAQTGYKQTNLISDGSVPAARTDANLINPWGLSIGQDFWIDSPGSGLSLVTDASGKASFNVAVPPAKGSTATHGSPAGTVFNSDSKSFIIPGEGSALFLFGTLDGTIAAWNSSATAAVTVADNSASKASYTDIAIDASSSGTFLLGANFSAGTVDVFDTNFKAAALAGSFKDPQMPSGFSPFGIHSIGGKIYVAYAQLNPTNGREVLGAGLGYVDVFDQQGNLVKRAISQGVLNAPWGMALAPAGFGKFANDLLVGNFGDGTINAYDPTTFALAGTLQDSTGAPITNTGLWEIVFGTGSGSTVAGQGDPNTLYIAAGINGGKGGVVAAITSNAPASAGDFNLTESGTLALSAGSSGNIMLSLAGTGGFNGPVTFSCSGLPTGDTCSFSPSTLTLSGTTASTVSMTVTAAPAATTPTPMPGPTGYSVSSISGHTGAMLAFTTPVALLALAGIRRRRNVLGGTLLAASLFLITMTVTGCSSSPAPSQASTGSGTTTTTPTPTPTATTFTVTAASGTLSHSVSVSLTQ